MVLVFVGAYTPTTVAFRSVLLRVRGYFKQHQDRTQELELELDVERQSSEMNKDGTSPIDV